MLRGAVPLLLLPWAALLAASQAGCGPVLATTSIVQARNSLDQATDAGAAEKAPYHYTLGVYLLDKAWEEQATSSYQASQDLAQQAERAFQEAIRKSSTSSGDGSNPEQLPDSQKDGEAPPASGSDDARWGEQP